MLADKADSDARIAELISHVNNKMRINVEEAQENLKMVLKSPNRGVMMDNLEKLKAKKKLDDAFLLLLQGNIEAATNANATDAVRFLTDVQREATNILDEDQAPEMQLLRRLLREGAKEARRALLVDAFAPTKSIAIDEETMTTGSAVRKQPATDDHTTHPFRDHETHWTAQHLTNCTEQSVIRVAFEFLTLFPVADGFSVAFLSLLSRAAPLSLASHLSFFFFGCPYVLFCVRTG